MGSASSTVLVPLRSLDVSVRSGPLDGFAAGSSELVIGNLRAAGIQSVYVYLFPIIWHQLVASPLLSTGFQQVTTDGFLTRSYQCVTCSFSTADWRHTPRSCCTCGSSRMVSNRSLLHALPYILIACIHRPHFSSFQMGHQHVCSCAPSRLGSVHNLIHFAVAIETPS